MEPAPVQELGQLQQAFKTFNQLSTELEDSYHALKLKAAALTVELERARAERDAQVARTAEVLNALPAAVVVVDQQGQVTDNNPEAQTLFGTTVRGSAWKDVASSSFDRQPDSAADLVTRQGRRVSLKGRSLTDGSRILLFTDVTETRELEALVARSERLSAMGKMAASLAHQIRTPLAAAMLYLSAARDAQDGSQTQLVTYGVERLHDLDKLVNDMLLFARGTAPAENVRIADIFAEVHRAVTPAKPPRCHLAIGGADVLHEIEANRVGVVTALTNLVCNAFEAAPANGVVSLSAKVRRDRVEFTVADNGPGIPQSIVQRVFEPFFSTRSQGTGLGLAVVKTVTEAHGGSVNVGSGTGGGARVGIDLPVHVDGAGSQQEQYL